MVNLFCNNFLPILNFKRNEFKFEIDSNITLKEANFMESDVLYITGQPIKVNNTVKFPVSSDRK